MKKLNLKEIQKVELDILLYFSEVCNKNGLRYGLTSGTLLGAVRHGGFIPWDDDIDVVMPRPDYLKFVNIMNDSKGQYVIGSPYNKDEYIYEYVKLMDKNTILIEEPDSLNVKMSVYIDVFPVDGLPEDRNKQLKLFSKVKRLQVIYAAIERSSYKKNNASGIRKIMWCLLSVLKKIKLNRVFFYLLDNASMKYNFEESQFSAVLTGQGLKEVFSKEEYSLSGKVLFEGIEFSTYLHPELYLKQFFGNYHMLPPEEERYGHNNEVWMV